MLGWRLLVSVILIPFLAGLFYLDQRAGSSAPILYGLCCLIIFRGCWELTQLLAVRNLKPGFAITSLLSLLICTLAWLPYFSQADPGSAQESSLALMSIGFSVSILLIFLKSTILFQEPGRSVETMGAEILTVSYVGFLLALLAQLRWVAGPETGYLALGSLIISAKMGDIGGYTFGRLWGRKKLVPRLSPGKTWVGAYGAIFGAALGSLLWFQFTPALFNPLWTGSSWYWAILFGAIIGLVGLVGDLCESLIKRDVGKKDSAELLPGFGGLLDLLDSPLYAGPVALILWKLLPLITVVTATGN
ncbi:phosphatidate cytidylyltransferase [Gimesia sp.]|uniref:phosphatidate cytidylyltransferase n=1 Tax=Gimesia sp. TaxID=2024833 RepID=UPI000C50ADC1|nr:phosphatidate cytidylyltransferase [Gimesia sp.]MAX36707.1 phosphatidate cytidylyltransferase [Gimesia sp.]|tara:strand:- start:5378 stop:6289 length:912 start_codon:yes stop_codon:yes gene_type:complete